MLYSLRPELEFSRQTQHGSSYVVVKDPITFRYFQFHETHAVISAILALVRSPIDIETLSAIVSERVGAKVNPTSLERLLHSFDQKLLLDTPATRAKLEADSGPKARNDDTNLLYERLVSVNAEAVFEWLFPKVRWCFTPAFNVFAVFIILCGFAITFQYGDRMARQFLSLLSLHGILMVSVVVYCVTMMHEFAHGLTCRYFGGKVREVGFMLIYFMPALYCNVSDAWMFTERRQRIWVMAAGGYFQLIVWGMATVVWRVVAEDTIISSIALCAILFSGVQTLFNFNPLIKLDGYYILSDYLEIPNLRAKAFRAVHAWIGGTAEPLLDGAHRRALLIYGGLSLECVPILVGN